MSASEMRLRAINARAERREMREIIRNISKDRLTKSEKLILEKIANLWFAHRYGEGVIRPGRARLAKQCDVHVNTVCSALAKFREMGLIQAVAYARGGTKATRYTVNFDVLRNLFGGEIIEEIDGDLMELNRMKLCGSPRENCAVTPPKNCARYITNNHSEASEVQKKNLAKNFDWSMVATHRGGAA